MKAAILCNGINWTINKLTLYIYIYICSVTVSVCLSDSRSCSAPTSHHPCLES